MDIKHKAHLQNMQKKNILQQFPPVLMGKSSNKLFLL